MRRVDPIARRSPCGASTLGFDCAIAPLKMTRGGRVVLTRDFAVENLCDYLPGDKKEPRPLGEVAA